MFHRRWGALLLAGLFCAAPGVQAQGGAGGAAPATRALEPVRALAFVLLAQPRLPEAQAFRAALTRTLGGLASVTSVESDGEKAMVVGLSNGRMMIGLVDAPVPRDEIARTCRMAWYWREACAQTQRQAAHLVVMLMDTRLDRLDASLLLTRATAAAMEGDNAIAGYWGTVLWRREDFIKRAQDGTRASPPAELWVNFILSREEGGFNLSTRGLESFGLMEIEARHPPGKPHEVLTLVDNTARYLLVNGPVIADGDTIGESPALNIRVRHAASYWNEGKQVYRIVYP